MPDGKSIDINIGISVRKIHKADDGEATAFSQFTAGVRSDRAP